MLSGIVGDEEKSDEKNYSVIIATSHSALNVISTYIADGNFRHEVA